MPAAARHPELRWTAAASDVSERAQLQGALLRQCASYVRPGGRLVYAVCSLEPEEGEAVVAAFLACDDALAAGFTLERSEAWTPEAQHGDGFWLARLRRTSAP